MKTKLLLTTAIVGFAAASSANAVEIGDTDIIDQNYDETVSINGQTDDPTSAITVSVDGKIIVNGQVRIHGQSTIDATDASTDSLTVNGYLTQTASGSIVNVNTTVGKRPNSVNSGLLLGNNLVFGGNLTMGNDTFIGLYLTDDAGNLTGSPTYASNAHKTLTVDGTLTFEGNNIIRASVDGWTNSTNLTPSLTIDGNGTVINKGTLTLGNAANPYVNISYNEGAWTNKTGSVFNIGLNTANGSYAFEDNSALRVGIASTGNGAIETAVVLEDANLNIFVDIAQGTVIADGDEFNIGVIDTATNAGATVKYINDRYTIVDTGMTGADNDFIITSSKSAADVVTGAGASESVAAAANFWDAATGSDNATVKALSASLNTLSQSDAKAYAEVLETLGPDINGLTQSVATETFNVINDAITSRLTGGSSNMPSGSHDGNMGSVWVQGLYNFAEMDDTNKARGFDGSTYGFAIGAEMQANEATKVGLAYAYTFTDLDGHNTTTEVDGNTFLGYAEYKPYDFFVNGIISYGMGSYDQNKNVSGTRVNADYDADTFVFQVKLGQDFMVSPNVTITPDFGIRYMNVDTDSYTDTAGQTVSTDALDAFTAMVGARMQSEHEYASFTLIPEVSLGVSYDMFSDGAVSMVELAGVAGSYRTEGEALDELAFNFGVGLTTEFANAIELSVNYDGQFRSDYYNHTGMVKVQYNF